MTIKDFLFLVFLLFAGCGMNSTSPREFDTSGSERETLGQVLSKHGVKYSNLTIIDDTPGKAVGVAFSVPSGKTHRLFWEYDSKKHFSENRTWQIKDFVSERIVREEIVDE